MWSSIPTTSLLENLSAHLPAYVDYVHRHSTYHRHTHGCQRSAICMLLLRERLRAASELFFKALDYFINSPNTLTFTRGIWKQVICSLQRKHNIRLGISASSACLFLSDTIIHVFLCSFLIAWVFQSLNNYNLKQTVFESLPLPP